MTRREEELETQLSRAEETIDILHESEHNCCVEIEQYQIENAKLKKDLDNTQNQLKVLTDRFDYLVKWANEIAAIVEKMKK